MERPDIMEAMPTLAADRQQLSFYLLNGRTPDNLHSQALRYMRRWHRRRGTAVLLLWGEGYSKITAVWPDGRREETDTEFVEGYDR